MIEQIIESIIKELGATGILIIAITWILQSTTKKILAKLDFLNDELQTIIRLLKSQNYNQKLK